MFFSFFAQIHSHTWGSNHNWSLIEHKNVDVATKPIIAELLRRGCWRTCFERGVLGSKNKRFSFSSRSIYDDHTGKWDLHCKISGTQNMEGREKQQQGRKQRQRERTDYERLENAYFISIDLFHSVLAKAKEGRKAKKERGTSRCLVKIRGCTSMVVLVVFGVLLARRKI